MTVAALTFQTPWGTLAALAALLPLAALWLATRNTSRAATALGLRPSPRVLFPAALAAGACICVGLAAGRPALRTVHHQRLRSQSEVLYIVDVSRSMAAAARPAAPTRLVRARAVVRRIHDAVDDVPSGLAGLTDRVLPYAFATGDNAVFDETLKRSVVIEVPPPQEVSTNATRFGALAQVIPNGFFDATAKHRTCVLVSDGETASYSTPDVAQALAGDRGCKLVIVRVGGTEEHVYGPDGAPEPGYAPDPAAAAKAQALAEATGGRAFTASDLGGAVGAVRAAADVGPTVQAPSRTTTRALAPWLAALALLLTVAFAAVRLLPTSLRGATIEAYNRSVGRRATPS